MGFQDVVFLPIRASFFTTFLRNCGSGDSIRTTTCHKTVVGGKQGNAAYKIFLLQRSLFFVSVEFHGDHTADTKKM